MNALSVDYRPSGLPDTAEWTLLCGNVIIEIVHLPKHLDERDATRELLKRLIDEPQ